MSKAYKLTPAQYQNLLTMCQQNHISTENDTISADGVTMKYDYDGNATLTLTLESKHFPASVLSDAAVFQKLEKATGLNPNA